MKRIVRSEHPATKAMGLIASMVRSGRISASEREMLEAVIAPAAETERAAARDAGHAGGEAKIGVMLLSDPA